MIKKLESLLLPGGVKVITYLHMMENGIAQRNKIAMGRI